MGQTGRRSLATHILAVKIALATAHFHDFGVARQGPWNTGVNKAWQMQMASPGGSMITIARERKERHESTVPLESHLKTNGT